MGIPEKIGFQWRLVTLTRAPRQIPANTARHPRKWRQTRSERNEEGREYPAFRSNG
jgi:hypothetical protein